MPLQMRLPKVGFKNINRVSYTPFNLIRLQEIATKLGTDTLDVATLLQHGYISRKEKVKVLNRGEFTGKLNLTVNAISESAKAALEKNGGTVNLV